MHTLFSRLRRCARSRTAATTCALTLACSLASAQESEPGEAQSDSQTPEAVFSETLDVRVVNVEVVVTDRQGERVQGLGIEDFELLVDGQAVPIEYFTEVRGGRAMGGGREGARDVPTLTAGAEVGTSYLVFLDEFFTRSTDQRRVLDEMRDQLAMLRPEDRMAVVAWNGRDLEMLTSWTQSREELERVLREAQGRRTLGLQREAEWRQAEVFLENATLTAPAPLDSRLTLEERSYVERLQAQLERAVAAATSTLRSFGSPPGRKVMLLFSGGWPYDPADFIVNDPTRPVIEPGVQEGDDLFEDIADTANLLGYTVYPVDVAGLQFPGTTGADRSAPISPSGPFAREAGVHQTLLFLAEETGGRALVNDRRREALEAVIEDTRSYYWLGFSPTRSGDDQRHAIEVRVRGDRLRVRAREGFVDLSREREVTMQVESALYFGSPPSAEPLVVQIGRPEQQRRRKMEVPIFVAIPVDEIALLPVGGTPENPVLAAQLELRIAVLDEDGATADVPVIPLDLRFEERPAEDSYVRYDTRLRMRRKPHDIVVALYDVNTGLTLSSTVEVNPD